MGSHGAESKSDQSDLDDALQPVVLPAPKPKPKPGKPGERVDTSHAPTLDQVLDPQRPDMNEASQADLADSIADTVEKIYNGVFVRRLIVLGTKLGEVAPPPKTDLALKIVGVIVEGIAVAALNVMGGLAVEAVGEAIGIAVAKPALDGVRAVGREAGSAVRDAVESKGGPVQAVPGADLLTEFIEREQLQLLAKQHDMMVMFRMIRRSAARTMPHDLARLDQALRSLLDRPELGSWFSHRVTMEWLNLCARIALGKRPEGQHTDMPGANEKGGIARSGRAAALAWHGDQAGFVNITIGVDGGGENAVELQFLNAGIASGPGAQGIMKDASNERDERGARYTLATLPVYRRIYVKTGETRLDEHPVFVITPNGAIEVDLDDPVLARIGAGNAMQGARAITRVLTSIGSEALR